MSEASLFAEDDGRGEGYRLQSFELFNWGSFDGSIYRLEPGCDSSLLTGANGSGKTTLVDALVTLLVPPARRHYNQSSGAELKRERTELTYVLGAYGNLQDTEGQRQSAQYLRERDTYSVLAGVFRNAALGTALTLAQVRWLTGGNLQRVYVVVRAAVSIGDLQPFDKEGVWKRRIKEELKAQVYDSFEQYSQAFSREFGFRSEKALSLFSQTVGVKVLGDLNEFIRTHMLEEQGFQERFAALDKSYDDLLSSHLEIEKAREQLALLAPVLEHGASFRAAEAEHKRLAELIEAHPALFAREARRFLTGRLERLAEEQAANELALGRADDAIAGLTEERDTLNRARAADSTAMRLQQIEQEIRHLEERRDERRAARARYDELAAEVGLPVTSEDDFRANRTRLAAAHAEGVAGSAEARQRLLSLSGELNTLRSAHDEVAEEVRSLSSRTSNIPRRNLDLRALVAHGTGIAETEIPFAGELIRVRREESTWEPALEKLLRSFALCVLVPQHHYRKINGFVRDHDLRGRLVYFQVAARIAKLPERPLDAESAIAKLEVKPDTPFTDWIQDHLRASFDYRCTDDLEAFARLARGITRSGLIKSETRHEKDDRPPRAGGADNVLGWDNREKLRTLTAQARELETQVAAARERLAAAESELEEAQARQSAIERLLEYREYAPLDWKECVVRIEELASEHRSLVGASARLKELDQGIARVDARLKAEGARRDGLVAQARSLAEADARDRALLADRETLLLAYDHVDLDAFVAALAPYLARPFPLPEWELIEAQRESSRDAIARDQEAARRAQADAHRGLELAMARYCTPPAAIATKYPGWSADVIDLRAEAAYLEEFERVHERISKEDLPKYQQRFRQYLNDRMLEELVDFSQSLDTARHEIEEGVAELNESLGQILYNRNPPTYIEIQARATSDVQVREFREKLRGAIGDAGLFAQGDEAELEHAFGRTRDLVLALRGDESWRRKVLDVRNWLQFSAMERHKADGSQKQYYQDSRSLSGGEKAKLAYTILASAIAFQFGIRAADTRARSFRFVIVDEAFSKVDPANAAYAMELFRTLELQLMVVTPLDKINVVEDYVAAVHFVENRDQRRSSVYNMTLERYLESKEEYRRAGSGVAEPLS